MSIKQRFVDLTVEASKSSVRPSTMTFNHMMALDSSAMGRNKPWDTTCIFAQGFRLLHQVEPVRLRAKLDGRSRLFTVKFEHEDGIDWGGLFREAMSEMVDDLCSDRINLFVPCPNNASQKGGFMDTYIPNPEYADAPQAIVTCMYEFAGKLMGISLRNKLSLAFLFAPFVYKLLSGLTLEEVRPFFVVCVCVVRVCGACMCVCVSSMLLAPLVQPLAHAVTHSIRAVYRVPCAFSFFVVFSA